MKSSATGLDIDLEAGGLGFWIHVSPRARKSGAGGLYGDALRVSVRAAPQRGAANAECVRVLAQALGVARTRVGLAGGAKGRRKRISIEGEPGQLEAALLMLASRPRVG